MLDCVLEMTTAELEANLNFDLLRLCSRGIYLMLSCISSPSGWSFLAVSEAVSSAATHELEECVPV